MAYRPDQISRRARIAWHVAFYVLAVVVYVFLADGEGRRELVLRLMVIFWPVVAALDVMRAERKARKG
jgi:steroid 5-alpha reductase family enzyme